MFSDIFVLLFSYSIELFNSAATTQFLVKLTKLTACRRRLTSISRIITLLPFVYKKFFPFGSPFKTVGTPLTVFGKVENMRPENIKKAYWMRQKQCRQHSLSNMHISCHDRGQDVVLQMLQCR